MRALSWADGIGLAAFLLLYIGYAPISRVLWRRSVNAQLGGLRVDWMRTMLRRDNRIVDSALIGHVAQSASFFASTSLIVIGALLSLLSNAERLQPALEGLAFVPPVARVLFERKIVLPLAIMVHGFVRFTWSIRQLIPTVMKNDRWYESWFGAPPPANPARNTNGLDRWKSHRSRPLVLTTLSP